MTESVLDIANSRQPELVQHFAHIINRQELAHAYLLTGMAGSGKVELALEVTMRLFCLNVSASGMPCGVCEECVRIASHQHPDVVMVAPDGLSIKVDQVRYLKAEFSKSAVEGNQKVFIISDAEKMTTGAANSLLKFIEEPTGNDIAFLLTTNKNLILPTIISRTQVVDLLPVSAAVFETQLADQNIPATERPLLAKLTNSVSAAHQLTENDWLKSAQNAVGQWLSAILKQDERAFVLVQTTLVPLASDRTISQTLLDIQIEAVADILSEHEHQSVAYSVPELTEVIRSAAVSLSTDQIVQLVTTTLNMKSILAMNVSYQNTVEQGTLNMLKTMAG